MALGEINIKNTPKQKNNSMYSNSSWYHYYVGFSDSFVAELIKKYCKNSRSIILDPWNGAGTTTLVSSILGYRSYGFDINPVMIIVSRAKLYNLSDLDSNIIAVAINKRKGISAKISKHEDPLAQWFDNRAVFAIRTLEQELRSFCKHNIPKGVYIKSIWNYENLPVDLCFFYVVLFNVLRKLTKPFTGSNPTWIKTKVNEKDKTTITYSDLCTIFMETLRSMEYSSELKPNELSATLKIANSTNLPITYKSIDLVLTSPPYCTRIDYAIYTVVELSLLGYSNEEFNLLRRNMIGTPTIIKTDLSSVRLGTECMHTLNKIKNHESKAAASYYYKTYFQYFTSMQLSVREICRIVKDDGVCILVVQDSWFKDIHIPITKIISEFFSVYSFKLHARKDNPTKNNIRYINTKSNFYNTRRNTETVLIFAK